MAEEKKLQQTKSQFKIRGIVNRLDNADVKEGETGTGKDYKSLRFSVFTNDCDDYVNEIFVELFGMVKDKVIAYNQKEKKSLKLDWDERDDIPEGYQLIGIRTNFDGDANIYVEYNAVDEIKENFSDGDSVYISGDVNFNTYENQEGEKQLQTQYQIKSISKTKKPIDFESEKFKETNAFNKEIVFIDSERIKEDEINELHITGRQINYDESFVDGKFVIDIDKYKKLAGNVHKKLKFGDLIKVEGYVWNRANKGEIEQPEDDGDEFGGGETPEGMKGITNYENKLEVTNVDGKSWEKQKYKEDDFQVFLEENDGDESNPFDEGDNGSEEDPFS